MDTSTYFDLNLVTGSDKVNPLTVDRPNYEKIDDQMHKNQINSVVEATELKSGNVHAITCLTEGAVFFRFTATSDYAAGDTFTYNGTPVSAVLPDGSGLQPGAFKINGTVLCSIIGTLLTVYSYTASGIAADSEKLGGQLPAYYAKATDAISTYIHSRIGTVNNFVGNGANGKVKIVANIEPGDTVQINGQTVAAYAGASDFVETFAGVNLVGKTLFFIYDSTNSIVNFNGGGGKVTVSGLTADAVKEGTTVTVKQGANVVASVVGAFAGEVKAMGFFSVAITGDPRFGKSLFGVVRCSDQSLIADVSHNGTQWGSNTYTVTFRRTAKLRVIGRGPFAIAVGETVMNGSLQTVDVTAGTSIGVKNYTGSNQSPNTISFVEL